MKGYGTYNYSSRINQREKDYKKIINIITHTGWDWTGLLTLKEAMIRIKVFKKFYNYKTYQMFNNREKTYF